MPERAPFDIKAIADRLELRKENKHSTVLLLGARAGALFRGERLYLTLQKFSHRDFAHLTHTKQFGECFTTLTHSQFSEADIHGILRESLQESKVTQADACLAELIMQEHFSEVISTNIDDLLEQALVEANQTLTKTDPKYQRDFEIFYTDHSFYGERSSTSRVTKVFGDFSGRNYNLKRSPQQFDSDQEFKSSLRRILAKDILMIGLDPVWDEAILRLIPEATGTVWFVSEEDLTEDPLIGGILSTRPTEPIVGREGRFDYFVRALHRYLYGGVPLNYQLAHDISNRLVEISLQLETLQHGNTTIQGEIRKMQEEIKKILHP